MPISVPVVCGGFCPKTPERSGDGKDWPTKPNVFTVWPSAEKCAYLLSIVKTCYIVGSEAEGVREDGIEKPRKGLGSLGLGLNFKLQSSWSKFSDFEGVTPPRWILGGRTESLKLSPWKIKYYNYYTSNLSVWNRPRVHLELSALIKSGSENLETHWDTRPWKFLV